MVSFRTVAPVVVLVAALSLLQVARAQESLAEGQVVKVDEPAGTITLKHGPVQSLGMNEDGKTDDFRVKDGLVFNAIKEGDKIRFAAERVNGQATLTRIEK